MSHCWLRHLFDAFVLLYYSWVPDDEKHLYKEDICLLYEKYDLNEEAISIVKSFHVKFKAKNLTKEEQESRERLTSKLFDQKSQFQQTANFFLSVLPLFKSLVLILIKRAVGS